MSRANRPLICVLGRRPSAGDLAGAVVWVAGDHDLATKAALVDAIVGAAQVDRAVVVVDMSGVTFMDASTIGAIIESATRLRSQSRSLTMRAPSRCASRVFDLCGLGHLVHPLVAPAVNPIGAAPALGTWVEVPAAAPGNRRLAVADAASTDVDPPGHDRAILARMDAEADHGRR